MTDHEIMDAAQRLAIRVDAEGLGALDLDAVDFVNLHAPSGASQMLRRMMNDPTERKVIRFRALTILLAAIIRRRRQAE